MEKLSRLSKMRRRTPLCLCTRSNYSSRGTHCSQNCCRLLLPKGHCNDYHRLHYLVMVACAVMFLVFLFSRFWLQSKSWGYPTVFSSLSFRPTAPAVRRSQDLFLLPVLYEDFPRYAFASFIHSCVIVFYSMYSF